MDALVHKLEGEIRERADEGPGAMRELLSKLENIRPAITRQDALRLEILIESIFRPIEGA